MKLRKLFLALCIVSPFVILGAVIVRAAYTGPHRTTTSTSWDRQRCTYYATSGGSGCNLTLYHTTGGCDSTSSVAGYFNNAPTACGTGWPGTCGSGITCSISLTGSSTVGCSSGDAGCTSHTTTTNLPPATVNGSPACASLATLAGAAEAQPST